MCPRQPRPEQGRRASGDQTQKPNAASATTSSTKLKSWIEPPSGHVHVARCACRPIATDTSTPDAPMDSASAAWPSRNADGSFFTAVGGNLHSSTTGYARGRPRCVSSPVFSNGSPDRRDRTPVPASRIPAGTPWLTRSAGTWTSRYRSSSAASTPGRAATTSSNSAGSMQEASQTCSTGTLTVGVRNFSRPGTLATRHHDAKRCSR